AKSDGFLRPLIERLKIQTDEDIAGSETDTSKLLEKFRSRLDISRRGLTYVIAMTFVSNNPQKAASYANAVAEAFVAYQSEARTAATDDAAGWLNSRLKTLSDRLRTSEDAVAAFRRDHKIVNAGRDGTTQQLRVTDLTQQVSAARLRAEEAKTRYQQAQRDLKANVEGPVKQDLLSILRAQRSALNDQIAQKRAVLGDRHPDLVISYSQLSELNKQIETERKRNIESAKSEYESLLEQQKSLEGRLKSTESEMLVDGQAFVKLQELQRDADANRNIYEQFLSRYKTTNEQRLLQTSQTKIASPATPPTRSTRPPLALLLAALALASILTSSASVAVLASKKQLSEPEVLARPADTTPVPPKAQHDIPVWARIPRLVPTENRKTVWQKPIVSIGELDVSPYLAALLEKVGDASSDRGKVAVVTSIEIGAGVSTVSRSLNLAALNSGKISVLIQVRPDIATSGQADSSDQKITKAGNHASRAPLRSVSLLLGGDLNADPKPGDDIRSDFDLIVIDAPPLRQQSEVASLAALADVVILVARDGAADRTAIENASALLSKSGSAALGLVINQVRPARVIEAQSAISGLAS
ncbi:MAG: exopolysaccharide transport family protein, partial [Bradyrhizobium sp.]